MGKKFSRDVASGEMWPPPGASRSSGLQMAPWSLPCIEAKVWMLCLGTPAPAGH